MRGRKPIPRSVAELKGKKLKLVEPTAPRVRLDPPEHLNDVAKAKWHELTEVLDAMKLLQTADVTALELCCVAYARYREAADYVAKTGSVMKSPKGYLYQSPFVNIMNQSHEQCVKLLGEFGLTPVARARLAVSSSDRPDAFEQFLRAV